jgi:hypothetical protein
MTAAGAPSSVRDFGRYFRFRPNPHVHMAGLRATELGARKANFDAHA